MRRQYSGNAHGVINGIGVVTRVYINRKLRPILDSWYASKILMLHIEGLGKTYYCPLKTNRRVDDSNGAEPFQRIDNLVWTQTELNAGKRIKIRGFPKNHKVKLFRVASST